MTLPGVLLVEDNAVIRRFVELALDELPIALTCADTLRSARTALDAGPFALVMSDLMLPDGDGLNLLAEVEARHPPGCGPLLVVFSARLDVETRAKFAAVQPWRVLAKPTSLAELQGCVMDAVTRAPVR